MVKVFFFKDEIKTAVKRNIQDLKKQILIVFMLKWIRISYDNRAVWRQRKIDQSERVNKSLTRQNLTHIDIDSRIWAPPN